MRTRFPAVVIATVLALVSGACGLGGGDADSTSSDAASPGAPSETTAATPTADGDATDPTTAAPGGTLRVALAFPPKAGLSVLSDDAFTLVRLAAVETLVRADVSGAAEPLLAESWAQTAPTTWRFELRDDVRFHDGTPLDASAVAGALNAVAAAPTPPRSLKGVGLQASAVAPHTVEITTAAPDPLLPLRVSSPSTAILAPKAYQSTPPSALGTGTGPFVLEAFVLDQRIDLVRNEDYWDGAAALDAVEARIMADPAARANALRAGEVDLIEGVPPAQLPLLEQDEGIDVAIYDLPRTTTLYLNVAKAPLDGLAVRQAIAAAIDRPALAAALLEGAALPAAGYFGPAVAWDPDATVAKADVARAKALLQQAGQEGLRLQLWTYPARAELPELATALQSMLRQAGIETDITVAEYNALEPRVLAGEHDLFLLSRSYFTDVADPAAYLSSDYTCAGGYNLNRYCSPSFDAALAPVVAAVDPATRRAGFAAAATQLEAEVVGVPILHDRGRIAHRDDVVGFVADPLEQRILTTSVRLAR